MSKYYYLISGLPNITFDDGKLPYPVLGFKDELSEYLTKADKRLLDILFLKVDNRNLLEQLRTPGYELETGGKLTDEELAELITGMKLNRDRLKIEDPDDRPPQFKNKNKRLPVYFEPFVKAYLDEEENVEKSVIPWEDRLAAMYYDYAMKCANRFIASWFELNLNINNIFTALTCRKYKLDRANYIVGDTEISNLLRSSTARDFELGDLLEYWPSVLRIAEDTDLLQRELKTDMLKWEWLDEQIFVKVFDIESVLTYMIKLQILDRWAGLDRATGDATFRQLVGDMKQGSNNALEEFKRNNKK